MEGEGGVGLRITETPPFRVRGCVTGGSAHQSKKVFINDTLIAVDGVSVSRRPIQEVRAMISGPADSVVQLRFMRPKASTSPGADPEAKRGTAEATHSVVKPRNTRRSSLDFALPSLDFAAPVLLSDIPTNVKVNGDSAATSDDRFIYVEVSLVRMRALISGESAAKAAERASWAAGQRLCKNLASPCRDSSSDSDEAEGLPDADIDTDDAASRHIHSD
jgi:hypothetical protein